MMLSPVMTYVPSSLSIPQLALNINIKNNVRNPLMANRFVLRLFEIFNIFMGKILFEAL